MSKQQFGLIGEKISYSISPQIHRLIFEAMQIPAEYTLMPVSRDQLSQMKSRLASLRGVNVTIPYKRVLMELCDELSEEARKIGAVNTILNENGKLTGFNTDYFGFAKMVEQVGFGPNCPPRKCTILGSGGASLSVIRYFQDIGTPEIRVISRTPEQVDIPGIQALSYDSLLQLDGEILINATPVGTSPNVSDCPVSESVIERYEAALDLIYNPNPTAFLKTAQQAGLRTCSGLIMLVGQAVKSEEIWHNICVPDSVSEQIYRQMQQLLEEK